MVATTLLQNTALAAAFLAFLAFAIGAVIARFIARSSEGPREVFPTLSETEAWIASLESSLDLAEIDAEWLDLCARSEIAETVRLAFARNVKRAVARATIRRLTLRVEHARTIRTIVVRRLGSLTLDSLSKREGVGGMMQPTLSRLARKEAIPVNRKTFDHFQTAVDAAIDDLRASFPLDEECPETLRCPASSPVSERPIQVSGAS